MAVPVQQGYVVQQPAYVPAQGGYVQAHATYAPAQEGYPYDPAGATPYGHHAPPAGYGHPGRNKDNRTRPTWGQQRRVPARGAAARRGTDVGAAAAGSGAGDADACRRRRSRASGRPTTPRVARALLQSRHGRDPVGVRVISKTRLGASRERERVAREGTRARARERLSRERDVDVRDARRAPTRDDERVSPLLMRIRDASPRASRSSSVARIRPSRVRLHLRPHLFISDPISSSPPVPGSDSDE